MRTSFVLVANQLRRSGMSFNVRRSLALLILITGASLAAAHAVEKAQETAQDLASASLRGETEMLFHAPASIAPQDGAVHACAMTPAFIAGFHDEATAATIAAELGESRSAPVTFLMSLGNDVRERRAEQNTVLWQAPQPASATCVAQCMRLPDLARPRRISLSGADHARCAHLPSEELPYFEAALIECGDGTHWSNVITRPVQGSWLVCGTVINATRRATIHRMTIEHEHQPLPVVHPLSHPPHGANERGAL